MKIDYIYGNPPYEGQLHLDILSFVKDFADEIVWLHPARWAQSLTSPKKYYWLNNRIKSIDLVIGNTKELFCGMDISGNLIITSLQKGKKSLIDYNPLSLRTCFPNWSLDWEIYNKIISKMNKSIKDVLKLDKMKGYTVVFSLLGGNGGYKNADICKLVTSNQDCVYLNNVAEDGRSFQERRSLGSQPKDEIEHVEFGTYQEAKNFLESLKTEFYVFINSITHVDIHVHPDYIPFMDDYTHPWNNESLAEYFGLSSSELNEIKTVVNSYFESF